MSEWPIRGLLSEWLAPALRWSAERRWVSPFLRSAVKVSESRLFQIVYSSPPPFHNEHYYVRQGRECFKNVKLRVAHILRASGAKHATTHAKNQSRKFNLTLMSWPGMLSSLFIRAKSVKQYFHHRWSLWQPGGHCWDVRGKLACQPADFYSR